jgi:hypothetical protein
VSLHFEKVDRRGVNPPGPSAPSLEQVVVARADSNPEQKAKQPVEDPVGGTFLKKIWLLCGHFTLRPPSMGEQKILRQRLGINRRSNLDK